VADREGHGPETPSLHFRRGEELGWWMGDRHATREEVAAARPRCPSRGRHWFTVYGEVGLRRPSCVSCGAPNPYFTDELRAEYEDWLKSGRL